MGESVQNAWQLHLVVFPATAFTLQTAWATGPNDANRKGEEHSGLKM